MIAGIFGACLPGRLRSHLARLRFGASVSPTAKIGRSVLHCRHLEMGERAVIGHFNICRGLENLILRHSATIGHRNWITALPRKEGGAFGLDRKPWLVLGEHSSLSSRHYLDCQDLIEVGPFSIIAGQGSQIWTHGIDVLSSRQRAAPVRVGAHCYVSTRVVVVAGAAIPSYSVIAAGAVVIGKLGESYRLYGGVPAKGIKVLPVDSLYFHRTKGFVD